MLTQGTEGRITTFYSFKGGVGRTMALANVAFLAAMNGKRVLAMDWDLEAPGLSYYFRSLLPSQDARNLKDSPGILNILWNWRNLQTQISIDPEQEQEVLKNKIALAFKEQIDPSLFPSDLPNANPEDTYSETEGTYICLNDDLVNHQSLLIYLFI